MVLVLSDRRAIDPVILFVRSKKPNINRSDIKKDHRHDAVMVTSDIKHKAVVAYGIHRIEHGLYFVEVSPVSLADQPVPIVQSIFSIRVDVKEVP